MAKRVDNKRRQGVALTLRHELGFNNKQIGAYLGLHTTSVSHLISRGTTTNRQKAA